MDIDKHTHVLILAGGLGTRLKELFPHTLKPLVPFGSMPFLQHQINLLKKYGLKKFVILAGPEQEQFLSQFQHDPNIKILAEPARSGTGGAVLHAMNTLQLKAPFLVINGDTWWDGNLLPFLQYSPPEQEVSCLLVCAHHKNKNLAPSKDGLFYFSQNHPTHSYAGMAWMRPKTFELNGILNFEQDLIQKSPIYLWDGKFYDYGTPHGYFELKKVLSPLHSAAIES